MRALPAAMAAVAVGLAAADPAVAAAVAVGAAAVLGLRVRKDLKVMRVLRDLWVHKVR